MQLLLAPNETVPYLAYDRDIRSSVCIALFTQPGRKLSENYVPL